MVVNRLRRLVVTALVSRSLDAIKRTPRDRKPPNLWIDIMTLTLSPEQGNLPNEVAKDLAELFKLLSDETRLRILYLLRQRHELNVRTLCHILRQSQPAVSHHLALLRVAGLIEMRRDGKHNFYRLLPRRFEELLGLVVTTVLGEGQTIRSDDFMFPNT
jgi:DNA-binding transcriptional ArsR family regulator